MKTIIVLTDFSKTAQNAANVALEIAFELKCTILLVNSYLIPFSIFSAEGEGRTLVDSALVASASEIGLKKEARRLRRRLQSRSEPAIEILSSINNLSEIIKTLQVTEKIALVVCGVHQSSLPQFFSAIDAESLLKKTKLPLLIVPKNYQRFHIENFVLATDLQNGDIAALEHIMNYAEKLHFHIHACHVSAPVFIPDFNLEEKVQKFEHAVSKLADGNISFYLLKEKNITKAIHKFNKAIKAEMLGIIYHPHSLAWKLLHESHTSQFMKRQKSLLLVLPQLVEI